MLDSGLSEITKVGSTRLRSAARLPVGTRGRRINRRILLSDRSPRGLYRIIDQFAVRPLVSVLRIVPIIFWLGPKAQRDCGVPIWRQIRELLQFVLFHQEKPWVYYATESYRPGHIRDAGDLVLRNEVKNGLFKALNRLDSETRARGRRSLGDKLKVAEWCATAGIAHPQPMLVVEKGQVTWRGATEGDLDRDLFVKPRRDRGSKGCAVFHRTAPFAYVDDENRKMTLPEIMSELVRRSQDERLMVQPLLRSHPEIADLAQDAVITLRLHTCLDEQFRPVLTNAHLRSVAKLEPTWDVGRIDDFAAVIDLESGKLGRFTGDKPECLSDWYDHHPVTGALVTGRIVPCWPEAAEMVIKAHRMVPDRVLVGWDVALTDEGPVLLEGNSFADMVFPQRVFRTPIGHMRLGELLHFHLDRLEARLDQNTKR